jgi:hypothetical protein
MAEVQEMPWWSSSCCHFAPNVVVGASLQVLLLCGECQP